MKELMPVAEKVATILVERRQTIAIAESSAGGLIAASLLAVPGASRYFMGGAVVYTKKARESLLDLTFVPHGIRSSSEPYALLLASTVRERFATDWGLSETGAAGPVNAKGLGNSYGDAAGHSCMAISGRVEKAITLETGSGDRFANMHAFAASALNLLLAELEK